MATSVLLLHLFSRRIMFFCSHLFVGLSIFILLRAALAAPRVNSHGANEGVSWPAVESSLRKRHQEQPQRRTEQRPSKRVKTSRPAAKGKTSKPKTEQPFLKPGNGNSKAYPEGFWNLIHSFGPRHDDPSYPFETPAPDECPKELQRKAQNANRRIDECWAWWVR